MGVFFRLCSRLLSVASVADSVVFPWPSVAIRGSLSLSAGRDERRGPLPTTSRRHKIGRGSNDNATANQMKRRHCTNALRAVALALSLSAVSCSAGTASARSGEITPLTSAHRVRLVARDGAVI